MTNWEFENTGTRETLFHTINHIALSLFLHS